MEILPNLVQREIIKHLDSKTMIVSRRVCKEWLEIIDSLVVKVTQDRNLAIFPGMTNHLEDAIENRNYKTVYYYLLRREKWVYRICGFESVRQNWFSLYKFVYDEIPESIKTDNFFEMGMHGRLDWLQKLLGETDTKYAKKAFTGAVYAFQNEESYPICEYLWNRFNIETDQVMFAFEYFMKYGHPEYDEKLLGLFLTRPPNQPNLNKALGWACYGLNEAMYKILVDLGADHCDACGKDHKN